MSHKQRNLNSSGRVEVPAKRDEKPAYSNTIPAYLTIVGDKAGIPTTVCDGSATTEV